MSKCANYQTIESFARSLWPNMHLHFTSNWRNRQTHPAVPCELHFGERSLCLKPPEVWQIGHLKLGLSCCRSHPLPYLTIPESCQRLIIETKLNETFQQHQNKPAVPSTQCIGWIQASLRNVGLNQICFFWLIWIKIFCYALINPEIQNYRSYGNLGVKSQFSLGGRLVILCILRQMHNYIDIVKHLLTGVILFTRVPKPFCPILCYFHAIYTKSISEELKKKKKPRWF